MKIPVFHDDQHGTAIVAGRGAAQRARRWSASGSRRSSWSARAPAPRRSPASTILVGLGVRKENIWVTDSKGVVYEGRTEAMDDAEGALRAGRPRRARWPTSSRAPTCSSACRPPACSSPRWWHGMADAAAHPGAGQPRPGDPARSSPRRCGPDCIIATGRSDYPNQVNNVLCFPFIFRGALDVGATTINEEMKLACVRAIAELARAEQSDVVAAAYGRQRHPLRPRLPDPDALRPAPDHDRRAGGGRGGDGERRGDAADRRHRRPIGERCSASSTPPARSCSRCSPRRPTADAAHRLRRGRGRAGAARGAGRGRREAGAADPGRPAGGDRGARSRELGLRLEPGRDYEVASFDDDELIDRARPRPTTSLGRRRGLTRDYAAAEMRRNGTLIGAMLVREGQADGMLCGTFGPYRHPPALCRRGRSACARACTSFAAMNLLHAAAADRVHLRHLHQPRPDRRAARRDHRCSRPRRCGASASTPRVALLSHSSFGSGRHALGAQDARRARPDPGARARARGRRRDARRRGALASASSTGCSRTRA